MSWLLSVPGASKTVLEAVVPYGSRPMVEFLGHEPGQYVSQQTAREMAASAYQRALRFREGQEPVVGLSCTATLATDRPKRGDHRCWIATWDDTIVTSYGLKLAKGERDRAGEEEVVSRILLHALAQVCSIDYELPLGLLSGERLEIERSNTDDLLRNLLAVSGVEERDKAVRMVTVYPDGRMAANESFKGVVLPGSFSPLHQGHETLARLAEEILGIPAVFEMSVVNVDKPPLGEEEVRRRLEQFRDIWKVVLTRAPTFHEKAALLPGCVFVVGWDTAVRIVHPRYYGDQVAALHAALEQIRGAGCRFLVAGRVKEEIFHTLEDIPIPREFTDLFRAIPEARFRVDVSSTELRSTI